MQEQMGKGGTLGLLQVRCSSGGNESSLRCFGIRFGPAVLTWRGSPAQGALMGEPPAPAPKKKALEGGASAGGTPGSGKKKH